MVPDMNTPSHASAADLTDHATRILEAMDGRRDAPADLAGIGADLETGLAIQQAINQQRLDRGDTPVGFKIGFTNRTIWPIYGVHAPIWAPVWPTGSTDTPYSARKSSISCWPPPS